MSFKHVHFRVFSNATEDEGRVSQALMFASGTELQKRKSTKGHFGNPMVVLEAELRKSTEIKRFLERLKECGIVKVIAGQLEARIDEYCTLHFRLDKQKAYLEELALAEGKDVIHCSLKVAVYPARVETALAVAKEFFNC